MSPLAVACLRGRLMSERVAVPAHALLEQEIEGVSGPAVGRRRPALRADAGGAFERVERLADRNALLVRRHVAEQAVLGVAVPGNVVAGLGGGGDDVGIELAATPAAEDRGRDRMAIERAQDPPQPFIAAVLRPLDGAVVDGAGLQRRRAREIARTLPVRPGLEQDADQDGDGFSAGPDGLLRCALIVHRGRFPVAGQRS